MTSPYEIKKEICEIGRRIYNNGFVAANDGNISVKVNDNEFYCTPTGVSKGFMEPDSLVKMDLDGAILDGGNPSSEVKMHLRAYQENPDITGVVHAHPAAATSFSVMGMEMKKPVVAEAVLVTGNILIAPYAKPGTYDVPDSIAPFINRYNAVLLANHGALSWGKDLYQALYRMEALEHQAGILFRTLILAHITGRDVPYLSGEALAGLVQIRDEMGILTGGIPEN